MPIKSVHLALVWTTSRAQATYGRRVCTLKDRDAGLSFSTLDRGADVCASSFGQWLEHVYADQLLTIAKHAEFIDHPGKPYAHAGGDSAVVLRGMTAHYSADGTVRRVSLDGAVGLTHMVRVAWSLGLRVEFDEARSGRLRGLRVSTATT
jgi:hypothetical protein